MNFNKDVLKSRIIELIQSMSLPADVSRREIIYYLNYQALCASVAWIKSPVLPSPAGGSANASFLYLLLSILIKARPVNILELGCGISTRLLGQYAASDSAVKVASVDHDMYWIDCMKKEVGTAIKFIHAPLAEMLVSSRHVQWYDLDCDLFSGLDLLVVDGPPAYDKIMKFNRTGAINLAGKISKGNFIVLIDDADRGGERELVSGFLSSLPENTVARKIYGASSQYVLASPNNASFAYL